MLRSMYTGISGMKGFQSKLDVVSNNIANVNTFGYKKGRLTFSDLMSQTMQGATGPIEDGDGPVTGGQNPMQVGLGTTAGSIDNIHTQGNRQTTNRPLDLAIEGDGMFTVAEKTNTEGDTDFISLETDDVSFTRAGNFYLDDDGYIVNSSGQYLVGSIDHDNNPDTDSVTGRVQIPEDAQSFSVGGDGSVNYVSSDGQAEIAGQIQLAKFSNAEGLEKAGSNLYKMTDNAGVVTDADGFNDIDDLYTPGQEAGVGSLFAGSLEMSNVDLSEEFTEMITSQRGFQANTRVITTSDEILQELVNLKR
ncbi:flagellar basal body rod protein FlgG [Aquisalibacillus elongatus]|uniref:Flagellar hook protein FlgE n=1 Tax=Aquisalibacillus elongatus TaxID=485577 RepID=A0A3N5BGW4_9BACI|nr:flagellar basal body rod protein FlgG [Aquisalibacillus elongatus]RPF55989.1 flagellar hook protein FlgE [Aquisalibacillus elongatus]